MAVAALCPQHLFLILTKRPVRMAEYFSTRDRFVVIPPSVIKPFAEKWMPDAEVVMTQMKQHPLPNVGLGTSVEDQKTADERIPHLLRCPAAVRFLSCEPLLGPVDFMRNSCRIARPFVDGVGGWDDSARIQWVIVGGESGKGARPMHPDWARDLLGQCKAYGARFFFKQWGNWMPSYDAGEKAHEVGSYGKAVGERWADPKFYHQFSDGQGMVHVNRSTAGHLLDGVEHHAWPRVERLMPDLA